MSFHDSFEICFGTAPPSFCWTCYTLQVAAIDEQTVLGNFAHKPLSGGTTSGNDIFNRFMLWYSSLC